MKTDPAPKGLNTYDACKRRTAYFFIRGIFVFLRKARYSRRRDVGSSGPCGNFTENDSINMINLNVDVLTSRLVYLSLGHYYLGLMPADFNSLRAVNGSSNYCSR